MPEFLIQLIPTIIILGVLIFVHEFGHFLACRFSGVGVQKFSIGFGPEILVWQGKETRYALSLIPFGGFVKPQGESFEEIGRRGQGALKGDFLYASAWKRVFIVVSGVLMNYLLAYALFTSVLILGRPVLSATVGQTMEGYPAEESGLRAGDLITALDGTPVTDWQDLMIQLSRYEEGPLSVSISRNGIGEDIMVTPRYEEATDIFGTKKVMARIGIAPSPEGVIEQKMPVPQALVTGFEISWRMTALTYEALGRLVTGQMSMKALSGPIRIVSMAGEAAKIGFQALVQFAAILSISLAVINLLPIPALDGGHLLFIIIEMIIRRPLSLKVQERITTIGFYFLILLMIFVFYNDLENIGAFEKIKDFFFKPGK